MITGLVLYIIKTSSVIFLIQHYKPNTDRFGVSDAASSIEGKVNVTVHREAEIKYQY